MADLLYLDQVHEKEVYRVVDRKNGSTVYTPEEFVRVLPTHYPVDARTGKPNTRDMVGFPFAVGGEEVLLSAELSPREDGTLEAFILSIRAEEPSERTLLPEASFRAFVKKIYREPVLAKDVEGRAAPVEKSIQDKGKGQIKPGTLIYSKVTLSNPSFDEKGKLFAVKEAKGDGSFVAYKLTSNAARAKNRDAVSITADSVNKLAKNSIVQTGQEFLFPASYPLVKLHGVLTPAQMTELMLRQESYKEKNEIQIVPVEEPVTDNKNELKIAVKNMMDGFRRDPKQLMEYLAFSAKFYRYSAGNCARIYAQNPYATFVGSKHKYRELGYQIKPNAEKIEVLRPVEKEYFKRQQELVPVTHATQQEKAALLEGKIPIVKKTYFEAMDVYDISQTNCPPSDYPKIFDVGYASEEHAALYDNMKALSEMSGVPVELKELPSISLGGYYNLGTNTITISDRLNDSERLNVMCHEYAHAVLHRTSTQPKEVMEFEAQSLANVLQQKFGLTPSENDVQYMVQYCNKAQSLPNFKLDESLARVQKQLAYIDKRVALQHELVQGHEVAPQRDLQKPLALPVEPDFPLSQ